MQSRAGVQREPPSPFAALLRQYRTAAGLTQEELSEQAGISPRGLAALETGERLRPRRDTVRLLADALHLPDEARGHFEAVARGRDRPPGGTLLPAFAASGPGDGSEAHALEAALAPLIGRAAELELLEWHLAGHGPPVLVLAGEPGIGKTRLLRQAAEQAGRLGHPVIAGGCQRRSGQEPYAPFPRALARSLGTLPAPTRATVVRESRWLVRLLPELAPLLPEPVVSASLGVDQERRLLFDAVVRLVANLAGSSGVLLLLDDLQWAPIDALDLLTALVQEAAGSRLRVLGAYRSTDVGPRDPLAVLLADFAHAGRVRQHMVEALSPEEAGQLLAALVDQLDAQSPDVQGAVSRTGGVPFYVVSYAQELRLRGAVPSDAVPWGVAHSLRQRVAALPLVSQEILEVAAIVGRGVPRVLLTTMLARPETESLAAIEAACAARLLEEADGDGYQFPHDVIREVIEADLGAARRKVLHRGMAETLERLPERERTGGAAALAWHFREGGAPEQALASAVQAGDEAAAVYAHAEAERQYRTAVELADELEDRVREAEALEKLGRVLRIIGRYDEALAALERAMEMQQRAGNLDAEGTVAATMGWVLSSLGRPEDGISRLQTLAERLEASSPTPGLAALYATLTHLFLRRGQWQDLAAVAERAAALAETLGDERMRVQAELSRAFGLLPDRVDEALAAFEHVIVEAEEVDDSTTLSRALGMAAEIYAARGEFLRSRAYRERDIELCQRTTSTDWVATRLSSLGNLLFLQGDWSAAREHYERAAGMTSSLAAFQGGWVRLSLARLCLHEGKWQDADMYLEESMRIVERTGDRSSVPEAQALLAARDLWHGRGDEVLARLEPPASQFGLDYDQLMILAEAYIMTGNAARAEAVVTSGAERAAAQKNRLAVADWRRLQGILLAEHQRWEEAQQALTEAASLAAALPYPYAHARTLYEWGRFSIQRGAHGEAGAHLEEALTIFRRLGARPSIERTEQALERLTSVGTDADVHGPQ